MKKIEILDKRKKREKHYLQEDGTFIAELYDEDIHFLNNGKYEEINNALRLENGYYVNNSNDYKVYFSNMCNSEIMKLEQNGHYINISIDNHLNYKIEKGNTSSKYYDSIKYLNILKNIDLSYDIMPSKIKENIILKSRDCNIEELEFNIDTDLNIVNENNQILAKYEDDILFLFEKTYMIDSTGVKNDDIDCSIVRDGNNYKLKLIIKSEWINNEAKYPITIDPTITQYSNENSVIDTYIYEGDTNQIKSNLDYIKVGVERNNNVDIKNRGLLWFELPEIGTGNQIISAELRLIGYPYVYNYTDYYQVDIHRVTQNWMNTEPIWNSMYDKYDSRVEGTMMASRNYYYDSNTNTIRYSSNYSDITELVQSWYINQNNYGIMLKLSEENYNSDAIPMFFSKDYSNNQQISLKPLLSITYINQTGIEDYMNFESQIFSMGAVYHNLFNGNLVSIFEIGSTKFGKFPASLKLIYNTHDVVNNNNIGYGLGYRLNFHQTIEEISIDQSNYLKYTDAEGTIHYFINQKRELDKQTNNIVTNTYTDKFFDEEGLGYIINVSSNYYTLKDKLNNEKKFTIVNDIGYLTEVKNNIGDIIQINYNSNNVITNITDANNNIINISYDNNRMTIVSPEQTCILDFINNNLTRISGIKGEIIFTNDNNLIKTITDSSGKKYEYFYYPNRPYKISKIQEYGTNNSLGLSYTTTYGHFVTTLIDANNKVKTISFNNKGNTISYSNLSSLSDISSAYGVRLNYDPDILNLTNSKNKLISTGTPIKYVHNYINNSSFESSNTIFTPETGAVLNIVTEEKNYGFKSLKCTTVNNNTGIYKDFSITKNKSYTFSGYFYVPNGSINIELQYTNSNNELVKTPLELVENNTTFERKDITIFYSSDAITDLRLRIFSNSACVFYIDDIQLEEGEVANNYNLIDNSDFSLGLDSTWELFSYKSNYPTSNIFSIENVGNGKNALKIDMHTTNFTSISKTFNIPGNQNDLFTLSFWYKNEGITNYDDGLRTNNTVFVMFNPVDPVQSDAYFFDLPLNPNNEEWQFFSYTFTAPWDFTDFELKFAQQYNANSLYITDINLFREVRCIKNTYDDNGNIVVQKDNNNDETLFKYNQKNELENVVNVRGEKFKYEYDNIKTGKLLKGISNTGISNEYIYDSEDKIISTKTTNRGCKKINESGNYIIRSKGTNSIISIKNNRELFLIDDYHIHGNWLVEKVVGETNKYTISHKIKNNAYINSINNSVELGENGENSIFELIENENGSYYLKNILNNKYLKVSLTSLCFDDLSDDNSAFQFYFEKDNNDYFYESDIVYTNDNLHVKMIEDLNMNNTEYEYYENGLLKKYKDAEGGIVEYEYNLEGQISSIKKGNKEINYEYQNGLLSKIIESDKQYLFIYDEFLNLTSIKYGDNIVLINEIFDSNNGNKISTSYANGQELLYEYDNYNRLKKLTKEDDEYLIYYDNNGNLSKVTSSEILEKFKYDVNKKLSEYRFNNFIIKYRFFTNENISDINYKMNNDNHNVNNTYDEDSLCSSVFDLDEINYSYDDLGRLVNKTINNEFETSFSYCKNGKRTTNLIKEVSNNINSYKYKYNSDGNITHIYIDDNLINKYYYSDLKQLIREDNYIDEITIRYSYDKYNNLLSKKVCKLNTYDVIDVIIFNYDYSSMQQLSNINNTSIQYDQSGNVTKIGNSINLTWINGKELETVTDNNNNTYNYYYNKNGIRYKKDINGIITEYGLENDKIIFEKKGNNMLYYLRNSVDDLIGFDYNSTRYFYLKNGKDEIVGIMDNLFNIIAKYEYDSWGNIISIKDNSGNDISTNVNHIANINPFRYKEYYYDTETGFYYLNNRYYNPNFYRFLSMDTSFKQDKIFYNLYTYCGNDPINTIDPYGNFSLKKALKDLWSWTKKTVKKAVKTILKHCEVSASVSDPRSEIRTGLSPVASVELGHRDTYKVISAGNKNGIAKIDFNIDTAHPIYDSTIVIETNFKYINYNYTLGVKERDFGSSVNWINGKEYTASAGSLSYPFTDIFFSSSKEEGNLTMSDDFRLSMGPGGKLLAVAVAYVGVEALVPALEELPRYIDKIGKFLGGFEKKEAIIQ